MQFKYLDVMGPYTLSTTYYVVYIIELK